MLRFRTAQSSKMARAVRYAPTEAGRKHELTGAQCRRWHLMQSAVPQRNKALSNTTNTRRVGLQLIHSHTALTVPLVETASLFLNVTQEAYLKNENAKTSLPKAVIGTSVGQLENNQAIADRMEALAIELRTLADMNSETVPSQATLYSLAGKVYSARRKVDETFGLAGFAVSPAWDIVLDLYQAKVRGRQISITSACIGGACPPTTGLRWLQALESMNLIVRKPDPDDKRRHVVELSEGGRVKVEIALTDHL